MSTTKNIPFSKIKLKRMIIISIIFIVLGILMITMGADLMEDNIVKKYIVLAGGILVIPLCCWSLFIALKKLKTLEQGLCITEMGIYDNSSGINIGLLKWDDIIDLVEYDNRKGTKSIAVVVDNPKYYIDKASNFWQKNLMRANYKLANTPIFISAIALDISYDELKNIIVEGYKKNKKLTDAQNQNYYFFYFNHSCSICSTTYSLCTN